MPCTKTVFSRPRVLVVLKTEFSVAGDFYLASLPLMARNLLPSMSVTSFTLSWLFPQHHGNSLSVLSPNDLVQGATQGAFAGDDGPRVTRSDLWNRFEPGIAG